MSELLYCNVLYCTVLYHTMLCYAMLYTILPPSISLDRHCAQKCVWVWVKFRGLLCLLETGYKLTTDTDLFHSWDMAHLPLVCVRFPTLPPLESVQHNIEGRAEARHITILYPIYFQNSLMESQHWVVEEW